MQKGNLEHLLTSSKELEKEYMWLNAADLYKKASKILFEEKDFVKAAELQERLGYCFFRASLQANRAEEFSNRILLAKEACEKAVNFYQNANQSRKKVRVTNSNAMVAFYNSLLEPIQPKKNKLLREWWNLKKEVLKIYNKTGDLLTLAQNYNDLLLGANFDLVWSERSKQKSMVEELLNYGEKAIEILSEADSRYDLAWAYGLTGMYLDLSNYLKTVEDRKEDDRKKSLNYITKALELAENTGDDYLIGNLYLLGLSRGGGFFESFFSEFIENALKQSKITRDNYLNGEATSWKSSWAWVTSLPTENRNKKEELLRQSIETASDSIRILKIFNFSEDRILHSYRAKIGSLHNLAEIETNLEFRYNLLNQAVETGLDGLKYMHSKEIENEQILDGLGHSLTLLGKLEKNSNKKKILFEEALNYLLNATGILQKEKVEISTYTFTPGLYIHLGIVQINLSQISKNPQKKIELLNNAFSSIEKGLRISAKYGGWGQMEIGYRGASNQFLGNILNHLYTLTKRKDTLDKAIGYYRNAIKEATKLGNQSSIAESHWQIAKIQDKLGNYLEASRKYQSASDNYKHAGEKIPQLEEFYNSYSLYMQAWSEIEQAKYNHVRENYHNAKTHYQNAGKLHEQMYDWNYLSVNYLGWAKIEQAEEFSRIEKPQEAIQNFGKAFDYFQKTENNIKTRVNENPRTEEKDLITKILKASDLRCEYCKIRILMEEAKLLDRKGKHLDSSKNYGEASQKISAIVDKIDVEAERKELEYLAILCQAWEKMATAEETISSESYLEAARLFEKAKEHCYTKKASFWTLGNGSFCKGLAAKTQFQNTFKKSFHSIANKHMKQAADYYKRAGFVTASEYAKATQRLFDAYLYMNSAEEEVDPEKKTKYYQLTEQLLQIAAGLFMKAKQPEKTAQVQQLLKTVKEEKALAVSLADVMHAPTIASSTMSFAAPSPTNEASVGLEQFEHANVQANLITHVKEVRVGESFCLSVEFVNAGKEPALLMSVDDFVPSDFIAVKKPEIYRLEDSCLNMKGRQIAPLKLVEAKLVLQPSKKGLYQLKPTVHYLDELGQNRSLLLKSVEIKVEEVILADRVSTGTKELDSLLLGGIPEEYAVVLTGSPSDEREIIIKNFLEAGVQEEQTSFYVTAEAVGFESLFEKSGFYLFLCNPKPKKAVPDLPNIKWLKSKTDLNNLNMALVRAGRNVEQKQGVKRIVIGNVSDVLLKDGAEVTRRWLSELIADLGSKGFTLLAVVNPEMHPLDQTGALLDLFDGVVNLTQTGDPLECRKSVVVKKLRNQDFIKNPICLSKSR